MSFHSQSGLARVGPGDKVWVIAPSGSFCRDVFGQGIQVLEKSGLRPVYDDSIFSTHDYLAGHDERRLGELRKAISDPDTKIIWCARGGYGATRLLPNLPEVAPSKIQKLLIGFSDITALHGVWQRWGWPSLHGPNITTLASWSAEALDALWGWLFENQSFVLQGSPLGAQDVYQGGVGGGNLTVLAAMCGGIWQPNFADRFVLLEDIGERPYRLDRSFTTLVQSGAFEGCKGFLVGQLTGCQEAQGPSDGGLEVLVRLIAEHFPALPILKNLPIGHEPSSYPLPFGAEVRLEGQTGLLSIG